jgi:hypothetical protein
MDGKGGEAGSLTPFRLGTPGTAALAVAPYPICLALI